MESITRFEGKYRFLSNFHPSKVTSFWHGSPDGDYPIYLPAPTVEHAYQAEKALDYLDWKDILNANTPGMAKKRGRLVKMRPDFDTDKLKIMTRLVREKFLDNNLALELFNTGSAELVEGNYWNDTYWGVCKSVGYNHLGKILMEIRKELHVKKQ